MIGTNASHVRWFLISWLFMRSNGRSHDAVTVNPEPHYSRPHRTAGSILGRYLDVLENKERRALRRLGLTVNGAF